MRFIGKMIKWMFLFQLFSLIGAAIAKMLIPSSGDADSDEVALSTILYGQELKSQSKSFRGGSSLVIYGGTSIDLREAELSDTGAHLELTTAFGGTELVVPATWRVTHHGAAVAGGEDIRVPSAEQLDPDAPHLTISSRTIFGGVSIVARPVAAPSKSDEENGSPADGEEVAEPTAGEPVEEADAE